MRILLTIITRFFLIGLLLTFIYQQCCLQFPQTLGRGFQSVSTFFATLKLSLKLTHMFSPFEDSNIATRMIIRNLDSSEDIRTQVTYRAPFRRSLSNLIEARLILNEKGYESPISKGFRQSICKENHQRAQIIFQKAKYNIYEVLEAEGNFLPNFVTLRSFSCH